MIPFEHELLTFHVVKVTSCTKALGGSITYIDEENSTPAQRKTIREQLPLAVARMFIKRAEGSKYFVPIDVCLIRYDGLLIGAEYMCQKNTEYSKSVFEKFSKYVVDGKLPHAAYNFGRNVLPTMHKVQHDTPGEWYIDGTMIYFLPTNFQAGDLTKISERIESYTTDVLCFKIDSLCDRNLSYESCYRQVIITKIGGAVFISPPIWKYFNTVGGKALGAVKHEKDGQRPSTTYAAKLDALDNHLCVNVGFALYACSNLTGVFGMDQLDYFDLDLMMINYKTVNLPDLPSSIKSVHSIGTPLIEMFGYLSNLASKCETLSEFIQVRACMKHLFSKGCVQKDHDRVDTHLKNGELPETMDRDQARDTYDPSFQSATNINILRSADTHTSIMRGEVE